MSAQTVLRGGTIIDGTGAPSRRADLGITDGRISAIGPDLDGGEIVDVSGLVVTPGFIDIHTHYDAQVFWDPRLTPSCHHGVTTVIAGNCGFSIAPSDPQHAALLARTLHHVEDMSVDTLAVGVPWEEFETFPQYLDAIRRRGVALNFGCYIGHTALRIWSMGEEAYERSPTEAELARMKEAVLDAMRAGAIGFATSHSPTHNGDGGRPVPSRRAPMEEVLSLAAPLRELDRGVVALLPGDGMTHDEAFDVWEAIRRPVTWTALLTVKGFPWHEDIISTLDERRREGAQVWPQVSGRPLVFQMTMADPFTFNMHESFKALMDRPIEERIAAYRDPQWRASSWEDMASAASIPVNWDALSIAESQTHPGLEGTPVRELAEQQGCTMLDVMLDVALDDGLSTRFNSVLANNDPDAIAWLLPRDGVLFGLADSGAHVSQLCDACFATDMLGTWVREQEVMTLERAVHKLTGEPAEVFGLGGRGRLEVGAVADIAVFDPATVAPGPLRRVRDFPADGERLTADEPVGVEHVFVGGVAIREHGKDLTGELEELPGTVL